MNISKNVSTEDIVEKGLEGANPRPITTANHLASRQVSKSTYRYKRLHMSQHKETKYQNYTGTSIQDFRRKV